MEWVLRVVVKICGLWPLCSKLSSQFAKTQFSDYESRARWSIKLSLSWWASPSIVKVETRISNYRQTSSIPLCVPPCLRGKGNAYFLYSTSSAAFFNIAQLDRPRPDQRISFQTVGHTPVLNRLSVVPQI